MNSELEIQNSEPAVPPPCPARGRTRWTLWLAAYLVLAGVICFGWLGATDVVSMEGIVADGARHMGRTGDWLLPHLYGELYNYKPPMLYWLAYGAARLWGGESEWALRFPIALSGMLMGLTVCLLIGRIAGPAAGTYCALAALTGALTLQKLRLAEFDVPLAAGVGVAIAAACVNLAHGRPSTALWLLGYLGLAFAFLSKGLAAPLAYVPGLVSAALLTRRVRMLVSPRHLGPAALFVVVLGLYILGVWRQAGFAGFEQALVEAGARGTSWKPAHALLAFAKPGLLLGVFLPWSPLLLLAIDRHWRGTLEGARHSLVLAAWGFVLGGLVALMAVPKGQTRYFLPLCVPVGILAGMVAVGLTGPPHALESPGLLRWARIRGVTLRICAASAGGLALFAAVQTFVFRLPWEHRLLLAALGLLTVAAAARAWLRPVHPSPLPLLAGLCVWGWLVFVETPRRAETRSLRSVAAAFDAHLPPDATLWLDMSDDQSSLIYYLNRPAQNFEQRRGWPPPGSYVVLFPGQAERLTASADVRLQELERVGGLRLRDRAGTKVDELILGRVAPLGHRLETGATAETAPAAR
ncbi:MAG: glycosyltransferase family 39 protein [Planctomycetota bacterium]